MNKLLAPVFAVILSTCTMHPVFAQEEQSSDPDAHCVTVPAFVGENAGQEVKITWAKTLSIEEVEAVKKIFAQLPNPERVTEVRLFEANIKGEQSMAGIAFGHDSMICTWVVVPPQMVPYILDAIKQAGGVRL